MGQGTVQVDVVIVGGGPSGSTAATLLRKYAPELSVLVIEKAKFPRDHVGESQLPSIGRILDEMGVWEDVERAGFPIKIGASYTWGRTAERWDFDFYPVEEWVDEPRPAKFTGQRRHTAFQVDRAEYDMILLRHAEKMGAEVREETRVTDVQIEGDRITGLVLSTGEVVRARHYIDASGTVGLLRRALGVDVEVPQELKNVAMWEYWRNAEWAVEIGVGATRVQVRSLPYGWIWFIPLGPDRTSIGLITPSEHFKSTGLKPEELYEQALSEQKEIAELIKAAKPEGKFQATKGWSQLSDRLIGENWFLVGEAAGFADPILAAGMSLAHSSAREAAYTILEIERGEHDAAWLRERYNTRNRTNIEQHIRFAQYWYAANGQFSDLQEHCQRIAKEAGMRLAPQQAWAWLSQGGFTTESVGVTTVGSFDLASAKQVIERFDQQGRGVKMQIHGKNVFKLNLHNCREDVIGLLEKGRIQRIPCYVRGESKLPRTGNYGIVIAILEKTSDGRQIFSEFARLAHSQGAHASSVLASLTQALEAMVAEYWVLASTDKSKPKLIADLSDSRKLRDRRRSDAALEQVSTKFHVVNRLPTGDDADA